MIPFHLCVRGKRWTRHYASESHAVRVAIRFLQMYARTAPHAPVGSLARELELEPMGIAVFRDSEVAGALQAFVTPPRLVWQASVDREPTWLTPARAARIWRDKGPFGLFHESPEERAEVDRVWKTLPGSCSWADALLSIAQGRHPVRTRR